MMLGVGETTSASDLFHTRLLAIHKELGDLLQSIGTHKITYMVRHDNIHVHVAGLGGSVGCAVRLETRRSRVQPLPRSATFFRGD